MVNNNFEVSECFTEFLNISAFSNISSFTNKKKNVPLNLGLSSRLNEISGNKIKLSIIYDASSDDVPLMVHFSCYFIITFDEMSKDLDSSIFLNNDDIIREMDNSIKNISYLIKGNLPLFSQVYGSENSDED